MMKLIFIGNLRTLSTMIYSGADKDICSVYFTIEILLSFILPNCGIEGKSYSY